MTKYKNALLALSALAFASVLLPGCGGKSEETPADSKDGAMKTREGGDTGTTGAPPTPGATGAPTSSGTGSLANPQPPEGSTK